jgi:hypothetical protein
MKVVRYESDGKGRNRSASEGQYKTPTAPRDSSRLVGTRAIRALYFNGIGLMIKNRNTRERRVHTGKGGGCDVT